MTPACQRCDPSEGVFAEYKVKVTNAETGEVYRFWYVCAVHLELDFGPWLKKRS